MIKFKFDNTEAVKEESRINGMRVAATLDVKPIKNLKFDQLIKGKTAYHLNGCAPGIIEEVTCKTLVIRGEFRRIDEWKLTPWTEEEKKAYWENNRRESERLNREVDANLANLDKALAARKNLFREFHNK